MHNFTPTNVGFFCSKCVKRATFSILQDFTHIDSQIFHFSFCVSYPSSPLTLFCVLCWPVRLPPFILGIKGVFFPFLPSSFLLLGLRFQWAVHWFVSIVASYFFPCFWVIIIVKVLCALSFVPWELSINYKRMNYMAVFVIGVFFFLECKPEIL